MASMTAANVMDDVSVKPCLMMGPDSPSYMNIVVHGYRARHNALHRTDLRDI